MLTWLAPGATMPGGGESTDKFGDGETTALISFGDGGGEDNDTKVTLPSGTNVSGAEFTISTVPSATGDYPSVVNVDVVVNALNLESLPDILDFYMDRGITEFDLLWPVPFGRAWENREEILCRPDYPAPGLREAIGRARSRGAVVWTNRLPPHLLEGLEELIQDPHKLHDEVKGRRKELEQSMGSGQDLPCL